MLVVRGATLQRLLPPPQTLQLVGPVPVCAAIPEGRHPVTAHDRDAGNGGSTPAWSRAKPECRCGGYPQSPSAEAHCAPLWERSTPIARAAPDPLRTETAHVPALRGTWAAGAVSPPRVALAQHGGQGVHDTVKVCPLPGWAIDPLGVLTPTPAQAAQQAATPRAGAIARPPCRAPAAPRGPPNRSASRATRRAAPARDRARRRSPNSA